MKGFTPDTQYWNGLNSMAIKSVMEGWTRKQIKAAADKLWAESKRRINSK